MGMNAGQKDIANRQIIPNGEFPPHIIGKLQAKAQQIATYEDNGLPLPANINSSDFEVIGHFFRFTFQVVAVSGEFCTQ
jgi:hypothetical protein